MFCFRPETFLEQCLESCHFLFGKARPKHIVQTPGHIFHKGCKLPAPVRQGHEHAPLIVRILDAAHVAVFFQLFHQGCQGGLALVNEAGKFGHLAAFAVQKLVQNVAVAWHNAAAKPGLFQFPSNIAFAKPVQACCIEEDGAWPFLTRVHVTSPAIFL